MALGTTLVVLAAIVVIARQQGGSGNSQAHTSKARSVHATDQVDQSGNRSAHASIAHRQLASLTLPTQASARTVDVPIFTWHRVAVLANEFTKSIPDETVEPAVFASEIDALAIHGYHPISQLQLFNALFHGDSLPSKPVLLSVDDGYVDDVKTILPILQAHHFVATFYVITHRFHEPGFLNPTEVRRLDAAGMDIGAHTRTHVPLATVSSKELISQVRGSREDLERVLGHPVQWFAYPFGSFDANVIAEVHAAGFVLAVTTQGGTRESSLDPLTMPRIHVGRSTTAATILSCAASPGACGGGGD
jgi:peptidoglycan/xylan/chitin deacetylase (PgdA/CDA1 family)